MDGDIYGSASGSYNCRRHSPTTRTLTGPLRLEVDVDEYGYEEISHTVLQYFMSIAVGILTEWDFITENAYFMSRLPSGALIKGQMPILSKAEPHLTVEESINIVREGWSLLQYDRRTDEWGYVIHGFKCPLLPMPNMHPDTWGIPIGERLTMAWGGSSDYTRNLALRKGQYATKLSVRSEANDAGNEVFHTVRAYRTGLSNQCCARFVPDNQNNVIISVWNCRGIARASFRTNMQAFVRENRSDVLLITDTRTGVENAMELLSPHRQFHFFCNRPIGFIGGVSVLWNPTTVVVEE